MTDQVHQAITILKQGGIVIFPTDTAFGIGCRIDNEEAIKKLFMLRKRPETQATPVLVADVAMAQEYVLPIPAKVKKELLDIYWPGALTVVLPSIESKVPVLVRGGGQNLGVRMPDHQLALDLITGVGVPLIAPSANFHGEETPFAFSALNPELTKLVDYVVPGTCTVEQASTVVDCSVTPWKILRQGSISL